MAYFALLGVWMATLVVGRCQAFQASGNPTMGTLLGVSYDAVRRCTFAVYSGAATLLRCQATRPSQLAGDYSMSSSCVIIGVTNFHVVTTTSFS